MRYNGEKHHWILQGAPLRLWTKMTRLSNFSLLTDTPNIQLHTEKFLLREMEKLVEWLLYIRKLRKCPYLRKG